MFTAFTKHKNYVMKFVVKIRRLQLIENMPQKKRKKFARLNPWGSSNPMGILWGSVICHKDEMRGGEQDPDTHPLPWHGIVGIGKGMVVRDPMLSPRLVVLYQLGFVQSRSWESVWVRFVVETWNVLPHVTKGRGNRVFFCGLHWPSPYGINYSPLRWLP